MFWLANIVVVGIGAALIFLNPDAEHHTDDLVHFQMADWSDQDPAYLLDRWGRPGFTILYAAAAQFGWVGAKLWSLAVAVAVSWLVAGTARAIGLPSPWLAGILVWAQPLFFRLSTTTLTELPSALYLAGALFLFFRGRLVGASLVFGLGFVTRHELVAMAPIWVAAVWFADWLRQTESREPVWHRCVAIAATFLPILVVNALSAALGFGLPAEVLTTASSNLDYGFGTPLTVMAGASIAFGAGLVVLAVLGAFEAGRWRGLILLIGLAGIYFGVHGVLRSMNWFATGGYPRFLVAVAPLMAILALAGLGRFRRGPVRAGGAWALMVIAAVGMFVGLLWEAGVGILDLGAIGPRQFSMLFALAALQSVVVVGMVLVMWRPVAAGVIVAITAAAQWVAQAMPPAISGAREDAQAAVSWLHEAGLADRMVLTTDPWIEYYLGLSRPWDRDLRREIEEAPPGTVLIYDRQFGPGDAFRIAEGDLDVLPGLARKVEIGWLKEAHQSRLIIFVRSP